MCIFSTWASTGHTSCETSRIEVLYFFVYIVIPVATSSSSRDWSFFLAVSSLTVSATAPAVQTYKSSRSSSQCPLSCASQELSGHPGKFLWSKRTFIFGSRIITVEEFLPNLACKLFSGTRFLKIVIAWVLKSVVKWSAISQNPLWNGQPFSLDTAVLIEALRVQQFLFCLLAVAKLRS